METGANGVHGALVLKRANKEANQEHGNVIRHPLNMAEKHVMASQRKTELATRKCPAQVSSLCLCLLWLSHLHCVLPSKMIYIRGLFLKRLLRLKFRALISIYGEESIKAISCNFHIISTMT